MPEIIHSSSKESLNSDLQLNFLFVDNLSKIPRIKDDIELCIIQTDFSKSDISKIKKLKLKNKNVEFWISTDNLSRENIIIANKIDVKTVISSPIDKKMVEEFFVRKYGKTRTILTETKFDYAEIENLKVMIVDDNNMNVELLEKILSKLHLNITSFLKPKEALQAASKEKFDLFLLDVMMPEMSGFELAKRIKECPLNKNVPVMFISALSDSHNKIRGYNLGSCAYIEKPFDVNVLRTQIFSILKNQKALEFVTDNKENFLATVAHDLKTPIRAEINALNLLLNNNLSELEETQQEIIEDLLNSAKFMQNMVENILCKSKIENDKIELHKQVYSIKELVQHCVELTKYILEPKNQKIRLQCSAGDLLLPFDVIEMKRAVHNLIVNASDYSPQGGEIKIKIFENDNQIGLQIQDFGSGIKLENQNDIFTQYMTMAKKHKTVGSGLGLFITKRIVEAHGGEITLESKVGYGTKITIYLPIYSRE